MFLFGIIEPTVNIICKVKIESTYMWYTILYEDLHSNNFYNSVMLEGSADRLSTNHLLDALQTGLDCTDPVISAISSLQAECGRPKRQLEELPVLEKDIEELIHSMSNARLREVLSNRDHHKVLVHILSKAFNKTTLQTPVKLSI
jgi:polyribonucleotide nucleotidyltransferase